MTFEYEIRLKDGRLVYVVGEAEVIYACDCGQGSHDHVESIEIESAVEVINDGGDSWLEVDSGCRAELESKVENKLYSELSDAA